MRGLKGKRSALWVAVVSVQVALLAFASTSSAGVRSDEVNAYRQAFGVPAVAAEKRLTTQHRAGGIVESLEQELGKEYAGVWFDNQSGEFVVPVISTADRSSVRTGRATRAIRSEVRTVTARYTWEELEAAQRQLDRQLAELLGEGLVQTSRSARANALVIHVAADTSARQLAALGRVAETAPVRVVLQDDGLSRFQVDPRACDATLRYCGRPLRGGVAIGIHDSEEERCTAGFRARGKTNGKTYLITAGHCFGDRNQPASYWDSWDEDFNARYIGKSEGVSFPPPGQSSEGDWGMVDATASWWDVAPWPAQIAYWGKGFENESVIDGEHEINREGVSYPGQYVCHSGISSGTSCGTVAATGVTVDFVDGEIVHNETRVGGSKGSAHCNIKGDSGGPWFAVD